MADDFKNGSAAGTAADAYASVVSFVCAGFKNKNVTVVNTGAADSLDFKVLSYAIKNRSAY